MAFDFPKPRLTNPFELSFSKTTLEGLEKVAKDQLISIEQVIETFVETSLSVYQLEQLGEATKLKTNGHTEIIPVKKVDEPVQTKPKERVAPAMFFCQYVQCPNRTKQFLKEKAIEYDDLLFCSDACLRDFKLENS